MKKVFLDTNIIIDLLSKREPFYIDAAVVFALSENGVFEIYVSALTFANTHYILLKKKNRDEASIVLKELKEKVRIIDLDVEIIENALNNKDFYDFEDALQYFSAENNGLDVILTRDLKDFKNSKIPIMTPKHFISLLK